jgi:hypothetical protein
MPRLKLPSSWRYQFSIPRIYTRHPASLSSFIFVDALPSPPRRRQYLEVAPKKMMSNQMRAT